MSSRASKSQSFSLVQNGLSNSAVFILQAVVAMLMTPVMLRHLGDGRYGTWNLASSIVGYFGLLDLGVSSALYRFVPLRRAQGSTDAVSCLVTTSMAFFTLVGVAICVTVFFAADWAAAFFEGGQELSTLMKLIGVASVFQMPTVILYTTVKGYERFVFTNAVTCLTILLRAALLYACIINGYGLVPMGVVLVILSCVSLLGHFIAFKKGCPSVRIGKQYFKFAELKELLGLGGIILGISAASTLTSEVPKQIVAKVISLEALGLFSIPLLLTTYYRQLTFTLTRVFTPRFGYLAGKGANAEVRNLFLRASRYISVLAAGIALLFWTVGPDFIIIWTKKPSLNAMVPALWILSAGNLVYLSNRLAWDLLFGLGFQKKLAVFEIIETVGICALTPLLCYGWGITGTAVGIIAPSILVRGVLQAQFVCRELKVSVITYYANSMFKPCIGAIAVSVAFWGLNGRGLITGWASLFLTAAVTSLAYLASSFLLALSAAERRAFLAKLQRSFRKVNRAVDVVPQQP